MALINAGYNNAVAADPHVVTVRLGSEDPDISAPAAPLNALSATQLPAPVHAFEYCQI